MGYDECICFRPGFLRVKDGRDESRTAEVIYGKITGVMSIFTNKAEINTEVLGRAMVRAGELGIEQCLANKVGFMQKIGKDGQEVSAAVHCAYEADRGCRRSSSTTPMPSS